MIQVLVPIVLGALGGGTLMEWARAPDDDWSDADVFNSRMRSIHMGTLQQNELFAKCEGIHTPDNAGTLREWRDYVKLWSAFYKDVGTVSLAPNIQKIKEAKRLASILHTWIGNYAELCGGKLPVGELAITLNEAPMGPPEGKPPLSFWEKFAIGAAIGAGGLYAFTHFPSNKE
jgi:hypothetical protein